MTNAISWGQLATIGVAAISVAFSVVIAVMIQKEMLDMGVLLQVFGFVGTLFGAGSGGYIAGKRSERSDTIADEVRAEDVNV